jgi:hypothetical protein
MNLDLNILQLIAPACNNLKRWVSPWYRTWCSHGVIWTHFLTANSLINTWKVFSTTCSSSIYKYWGIYAIQAHMLSATSRENIRPCMLNHLGLNFCRCFLNESSMAHNFLASISIRISMCSPSSAIVWLIFERLSTCQRDWRFRAPRVICLLHLWTISGQNCCGSPVINSELVCNYTTCVIIPLINYLNIWILVRGPTNIPEPIYWYQNKPT